MRTNQFKSEAEDCRRQAAAFQGKPEAAFLLRVASMFDELDGQPGKDRTLETHV